MAEIAADAMGFFDEKHWFVSRWIYCKKFVNRGCYEFVRFSDNVSSSLMRDSPKLISFWQTSILTRFSMICKLSTFFCVHCSSVAWRRATAASNRCCNSKILPSSTSTDFLPTSCRFVLVAVVHGSSSNACRLEVA